MSESDNKLQVSSRQLVAQFDNVKLYYYPCIYNPDYVDNYANSAKSKTASYFPLLIIYGFINRVDLLDISPDRSFIQQLIQDGLESGVYLIDWGNPPKNSNYQASLGLESYLFDYLPKIVETIQTREKKLNINLMGVCQGGYLALCYTAVFSKNIHKLITLATPVDFEAGDAVLKKMVQKMNFFDLFDVNGNLPGSVISDILEKMSPYKSEFTSVLLRNNKNNNINTNKKTKNYFYEKMCEWVFDSPDQSGKMFMNFIEDVVIQNALIKNNLVINNQKILLSNITMPVLNIYATEDYLWPIESTCALKQYISPDCYQEYRFQGTHLGIMVSKKGIKAVPKQIVDWVVDN